MASVFDPASPDAVALARFAWLLCGGAALVFFVVMALLAMAVASRRGGRPLRWRRWLAVAVLVPGSALAALFGYATWGHAPYYTVDGGAQSAAMPADALVIRVTARMWWWEVRYPGPDGGIALANELHVPAGRRVWLALDSADVIHTFWVPALAGKVDMVPGKVHHLPLLASQPGVWRGQCAEYCGLQHARMALHVVAQPPGAFDDWLARQAMPAAADGVRHAVARALFAARCAACHAVRGEGALALDVRGQSGEAGPSVESGALGRPGEYGHLGQSLQPLQSRGAGGAGAAAAGPAGPDLTHVAGRLALGAGTLRNEPGAMAAWLAAPHRHKEGIRMPDPQLAASDLAALAAWLETLR
jgi:cytochrome c oxidase subunit II